MTRRRHRHTWPQGRGPIHYHVTMRGGPPKRSFFEDNFWVILLARLWPFTRHNRPHQLSAPIQHAGLLTHHDFDSTLKNGNYSTNNAL
jgi:hypothetical protein